MAVSDKAVESFVKMFHHYHGALAPDFGCENGVECEWEHLTSNERKRFVAAARLAFLELRADFDGFYGELFKDWSSGGTEGRECGA